MRYLWVYGFPVERSQKKGPYENVGDCLEELRRCAKDAGWVEAGRLSTELTRVPEKGADELKVLPWLCPIIVGEDVTEERCKEDRC